MIEYTDFARVDMRVGRVVAVEPDNNARYLYSSTASGNRVFELSTRFFNAVTAARGEAVDGAVGPKLPTLFTRHGIEPLSVRLFPVSWTRLGVPPDDEWGRRREAVEKIINGTPTDSVRTIGREYLEHLQVYAREAVQAGSAFVEIQNTMLFATVGQKVG